jgi:hypothetical protein
MLTRETKHPKMANPYKEAAQLGKVVKLLSVAQAHGMTAGDMAIMLDEHWEKLEFAAGVNKCSEETRALALQTLRNVEAAKERAVNKSPFPRY